MEISQDCNSLCIFKLDYYNNEYYFDLIKREKILTEIYSNVVILVAVISSISINSIIIQQL